MYYLWRAWRLAGGIPSERPKGLPVKVPARWWVRIALYRLRHPVLSAPPSLGIIGRGLSALFDNPRGGIEDVAMMYSQGGLRTWFLNIRNISWDVIRNRVRQVNGSIVPWQRCYDESDVAWLCVVAGSWGAEAIGINFEQPCSLTPAQILRAIQGFKGTVYIITAPWMENDVDWKSLASRCVFIVEAFSNEGFVVAQLLDHAHKLGARTVVPMAGIYPAKAPPPASLQDWRAVWAGVPVLYLGDNLGSDAAAWSRWNPLSGR